MWVVNLPLSYPFTLDMFSKTVTTVLATVGSRNLDNSISAATKAVR